MASSAFGPANGNSNDASMRASRLTDDGYVASATLNTHDYSFKSIATATTTVVKTGAGQLHQLIVAGGTLGTIKVYDNTAASGTVILDTITPATLTGSGPFVVTLDVTVATGITVVTGAATVITVTYR